MNPNETITADGMALDPKVVKVMRAIRQIESSGNYDAIGDGGTSAGAFQWNNGKTVLATGQVPKNYWGHAKEAGVDVKDFGKASQNKVAYSIMKKWKDDGLDPEEIAAKWNGAKRGADGKLTYVAPEYGEKFRTALFGNQAMAATSGAVNPMQNIKTVENRPAPTPEPIAQAPEQLPKAPEEEEKVDFGTRLGKGVLDFVAPILTDKERTTGQWVGDAALTAMNVIPTTAALKYGIGAAKTGINALRGAGALSKTEKAAEVATGVVKKTLSPKNIAIGTGTGYGMDVASSLSGGETDVGDVLTPGVGTALGTFAGALARRAPRAEVDKAARDLIPDLPKGKAVSSTGKSGQEVSGLLKNVSEPVSARTYQVTESTLRNVPNFNRLGTYTEKLNAVNAANEKLAEKLAREVVKNGDDILYPYRELANKMMNIKTPTSLVGDEAKKYEKVRKAAMEIAKENGGNISGLFKARKEFDALVQNDYPYLYDRTNVSLRKAITDIRGVMNETIEQSLKGRGVNYSGSLREQSLLYDARDALASKAYSERGTNSLQRFGQNHPTITGALKNTGIFGAGAASMNWLTKD
jgi:hypothetical protein